jgi:pterin-4a-carbinolamine dehydratase
MATIQEGRIRALPGWQFHGDGISRTFHFDDFGAATRFVGASPSTPRSPVASPPSTSAAIA